jgi:hypothetical protein
VRSAAAGTLERVCALYGNLIVLADSTVGRSKIASDVANDTNVVVDDDDDDDASLCVSSRVWRMLDAALPRALTQPTASAHAVCQPLPQPVSWQQRSR